MKKNITRDDVSHLLCREIQAPLVAALIKGFAREIGKERAYGIAAKVIAQDAVESGSTLAQKFSGNSLHELRRVVEEVWAKDDTMEIENINMEGDSLNFDVTHCGYAEMYKRLGIAELGVLLSCNRDFVFMEGFNPEIKLTRTKTIMEGADCCDFRYTKKRSDKDI